MLKVSFVVWRHDSTPNFGMLETEVVAELVRESVEHLNAGLLHSYKHHTVHLVPNIRRHTPILVLVKMGKTDILS